MSPSRISGRRREWAITPDLSRWCCRPLRTAIDSLRGLGLLTLAAAFLLWGVSRVEAQSPGALLPPEPAPLEEISTGGEIPVDLQTALEWTLTRNPDLLAVRQDRPVSAAAWDVARRFPMDVNPTLSLEVRPWTFDGDTRQSLDTQVAVSWLQPIPLGRRRLHRSAMGQANLTQTEWEIVQAELVALVGTYRLHQSAVYRREKLDVAQQLAEFNARLVQSVQRQVEATQMSPADMVLAEVENQSMIQRLQTAEQDYLDAITQLRSPFPRPSTTGDPHPASFQPDAAGGE